MWILIRPLVKGVLIEFALFVDKPRDSKTVLKSLKGKGFIFFISHHFFY